MGGPARDWSVWSRVPSVGAAPWLDLLHARMVRRGYAPHMHEEYSLGACTSGLEAIWYRGQVHYAGPGSVVVLEPGEAHTGVPAAESGFAYRVMYPSAALLSDAGEAGPAATATRPHFRDPVIADPELAGGLRRLHATLHRGGDPLKGEDSLIRLFDALVRRHATVAPAPAGCVHRVAGRVMSSLADRMLAPPTLTEISADVGLSRYQLVRAFRAEVGMPPYAWLAQHRVARARGLLERGARPAEVAAQVGFADQAHLTRWFRRVLGVTPGEFRNSVQDSARGAG